VPIEIDISPILKSVGKKIEVEESEKVSYPDDGLELLSPVVVKGEFVNTGSLIIFKGTIEVEVKLNCSRCLKDFNYPMKFEVEEEFSREPLEPSNKKNLEISEKDFVFQVGEGNKIDLSEMIRQDILTELPIRALCSEECSG